MSGYTEMPTRFEVGAVLQHRPYALSDVSAPPSILIVGRDDELGRWLAIDPNCTLISVWDGAVAAMYQRTRPGNFRGRTTMLPHGQRLWRRALAARKVSMRTR